MLTLFTIILLPTIQVPSVLRDRDWADQSCVLGWAVAGLWSNHHYTHPVSVESLHVGHNRWISTVGV